VRLGLGFCESDRGYQITDIRDQEARGRSERVEEWKS
jgi:hypothetical protein